LIQRIEKKYNKIFHPITPDYTSAILALNLAKKAAYYPGEIMIAINNYLGTGAKSTSIGGFLEKFVKTCFVDFNKFIPKLPIPHIYTLHNLCAYDYEILNRLDKTDYSINLNNLAIRVAEDIKVFPCKDEEEYLRLRHHLDEFCQINNIFFDKNAIEKQENFNTENDSLFNLFCRFLKNKEKIKKIQNLYKEFYSTHYKNLSDMLKS
jgi:hypothetical protein